VFGKRCLHQWEKIVETILPSGYEQMTKGDVTFDKIGSVDMFQKKLVVILTCHKCGAVKVIAESNPR